jgi:sugar phosphate isomerase/epimerase
MQPEHNRLSRREFTQGILSLGGLLLSTQVLAVGSSTVSAKRNIKLGFDNFSIRSLQWKAEQILAYAHQVGVDVLLLSNLEVYENLEEKYLRDLGEKARGYAIDIQAGTVSICPTSGTFNNKYGTAQEHLSLLIRVARYLGSPVARCYLGHSGDRVKEGGIERHIAETVKVLKGAETEATQAGVKLAIENHAGDLQAWELVELIERAGKHFVGATMDAGNATWVLEDPLQNLEVLGPYALTTGIRDSAVWESDKGATVQWTNMGDGTVDWMTYLSRFESLCPGVPFVLEIISGGPREFTYFEEDFWKAYPQARAKDFCRFIQMAKSKSGVVQPSPKPVSRPTGNTPEETQRLQQAFDLEESLKYCKEVLGLGMK